MEQSRMTQDDVLFGYRLQLFALAARTSVSHACRTFGVHRSTYYAWKRQVDRHGLEMLRPRERRRPQMPNALPRMIEERILSFAIAHPGLGPRRVASELAGPKWGAIVVSPNGVWKVLRRHGLNTHAKRLGLIAGYAAPYEPPREPAPERHIDVTRPGELVGIDCFYVGRLRGTNGAIWQLTAIDVYSSYAWAELVVCPNNNPGAAQTSRLACRVARELKAAGWRLERVAHHYTRSLRAAPARSGRARLHRRGTEQALGWRHHVSALLGRRRVLGLHPRRPQPPDRRLAVRRAHADRARAGRAADGDPPTRPGRSRRTRRAYRQGQP